MQLFIIGIGKETLEEDEKHWRKLSFADFSLWPSSEQYISTGLKGTWSGRLYVHVRSPRKAAASRHIHYGMCRGDAEKGRKLSKVPPVTSSWLIFWSCCSSSLVTGNKNNATGIRVGDCTENSTPWDLKVKGSG